MNNNLAPLVLIVSRKLELIDKILNTKTGEHHNMDINYNEIVADFNKIKTHLKLPEELELHLSWVTEEGFYRTKPFPAIQLGLKDGYWRKLLVHEALHATGLKHYDIPTYGGNVTLDKHSEQIENEIFNTQ